MDGILSNFNYHLSWITIPPQPPPFKTFGQLLKETHNRVPCTSAETRHCADHTEGFCKQGRADQKVAWKATQTMYDNNEDGAFKVSADTLHIASLQKKTHLADSYFVLYWIIQEWLKKCNFGSF